MVDLDGNPKLYVGTYAKYNNGSIEGKWLDLTEYADKDEFLAACAKLHSDERDPELMFQDFEYLPKALYNESYVDERIWDYIELDASDREIAVDYLDEVDSSADPSDAQAYYQGNMKDIKGDNFFKSDEEAYGEYVVEEGLFGETIPDALQNYIDYEALGRDWLMDLTVTDNGNIFGSH